MAVIRAAGHGDLPELERIERLSFVNPHWRALNFLAYECTVAEMSGILAGFLVCRTVFRGNSEDLPEREILNLAVDPQYRRQGIATQLLRTELNHAGTHYLEVRESNTGARKLYETLGFKVLGRRAEYYSDPVETAIVMRLK